MSNENTHSAAAQDIAPSDAQPVAYLDLGVGGYMDVGTDLSDEQLAALPKGRHMLGIIGTYGVDGYVTAPQPAAQPQPSGNAGELPPALELIDKTLSDYVPGFACAKARRAVETIRAALAAQPSGQAQSEDDARDAKPRISDGMLACLFQLYDDAIDKARAGRVFANPAKPGSLEARAWDMGTERGKELAADARAQREGGDRG